MAYEILKTIVEAEEKAAAMKKEAYESSIKKVSDEKAKREQAVIDLEAQFQRDFEQASQDAVRDAIPVVEKMRASVEEECRKIRRCGEEKKDEAIEAVIRRVVGNYGSS